MSDDENTSLREGVEGDSPLIQVPIEITVSVGRARPQVRELLKLKPSSILPLDRKIDDPVDLFVGDHLVARGELEEIEGENGSQLAVRLTEVLDVSKGNK